MQLLYIVTTRTWKPSHGYVTSVWRLEIVDVIRNVDCSKDEMLEKLTCKKMGFTGVEWFYFIFLKKETIDAKIRTRV